MGRIRHIGPVPILLGASLLVGVVQALWLQLDRAIGPPVDSEHHLMVSLIYARTLDLGGLGDFWDVIRHTTMAWPPLTYIFYGGLAHLLGEGTQLVRGHGILLGPFLVLGVYRLGLLLGAGRAAASLAALLTLFSFGVVGHMRQISPDYLVALAILPVLTMLVRARGFAERRSSVWLGVALGVALLVRLQSLFFVGGPGLLVIAQALYRAGDRRERLRRLGNMGLAVLATLVVSGPWWLGRTKELWSLLRDHVGDTTVPVWGDPTLLGGALELTLDLGRLTVWLPLLAALLTLPLLLRRRRWAGALLVLWVFGGVVIYAATVSRHPHYILPATGGVALMAAMGLERLPRRWFGPLAALVLLVPATAVLGHTLLRVEPGVMEARQLHFRVRESPLLARDYLFPPDVRPLDTQFVAALAPVLDRELESSGGRGYVLMYIHPKVSVMPRVLSRLMKDRPGLLFADNQHDFPFTDLHARHRSRYPMLLIGAVDLPGVEPLWKQVPPGIETDLEFAVYRIPPGHPVRRDGVLAELRRDRE